MKTDCLVCEDVISNPICSHCLVKEIKSWLSEANPALASGIYPADLPGEMQCLFCTNTTGICAHCYCHDVFAQIAEKDRNLAKQFVARFDFDLRKEVLS